MKKKPVFKGERLDRTSGERRLCEDCSELATHRVLLNEIKGGQWPEVFWCLSHTEAQVKKGTIRKLAILPEYRLYVGRMKKWRAQQDAGQQGELL